MQWGASAAGSLQAPTAAESNIQTHLTFAGCSSSLQPQVLTSFHTQPAVTTTSADSTSSQQQGEEAAALRKNKYRIVWWML